ncbi:hypothetical protein Xph01_29460 [Micromonospora phaseoli]|nr:hypothetical protein Xph01_29460 [Micromonospora phaseoli]
MGLVTWGSNGSNWGHTELAATGRGVVDGTLMMAKGTRPPGGQRATPVRRGLSKGPPGHRQPCAERCPERRQRGSRIRRRWHSGTNLGSA